MKIVELEKEVKFEPVKLEITIETEEELISLWYRLNAVPAFIEGNAKSRLNSKCGVLSSHELFKVIDKHIEHLNLKKEK